MSSTSAKPAHHHHDDAKSFVRAVEHASEERGLRLTPLRKEVLELVAAAGKPVKAYDLLDQLRDSHGNAAPPTIYRALDFLLAQGLIHRVERLNAFVGCHEESDHPHPVQFLICNLCGSVTEFEDEAIGRAVETVARSGGFIVKRAIVEVEGECGLCLNKA